MKKIVLAIATISLLITGCSSGGGKVEVKKRGNSEIIFEKVKSTILSSERDIAVYLPPDYKENTDKKYPVLYMNDGQNLFTEISEGSSTKWQVRETTDKLIKDNKIEDVIIIGIYNSSDRIGEYTQSYMEKYMAGGKGKDYAKFLVEEVKPHIDKTYRTLSDRENTAIAGSSLGGLISFYTAWNYSDVFNKVGAISPSFWWDNGSMINEVENYKGKKKDLNIWIDAGNAEENGDRNNNGIIDMVNDARDMVGALNKKDFTTYKDVMYYEATGGSHNEDAWAKRFDQVLLYMFGKDKGAKPKTLEGEGWDTIYLENTTPSYINPVITYSNGLKQSVLKASFESKNEDILKIDERGFITPIKEGQAEIMIKGENLMCKKTITVEK